MQSSLRSRHGYAAIRSWSHGSSDRHYREGNMAEYERSRLINVSEDDGFAFVSDVSNLPIYVPTVRAVEQQKGEEVLVRGEIRGHNFEDEGWFHVEPARRRVEWGDAERTYSGSLTVAADNGGSRVTIQLSMPPYVTQSGAPVTGEDPVAREQVEASLDASLDSLRNVLEGRGGKEEPASVV